jgi:hypothetical protein
LHVIKAQNLERLARHGINLDRGGPDVSGRG